MEAGLGESSIGQPLSCRDDNANHPQEFGSARAGDIGGPAAARRRAAIACLFSQGRGASASAHGFLQNEPKKWRLEVRADRGYRRSFYFCDKPPRSAHQLLDLAALLDRITAAQAVFEGVFVAGQGTRSRTTAVHSATHRAGDRRRFARLSRPGTRSAAHTCEHRTGVTRVISTHLVDRAFCALICSMEIGVLSRAGSIMAMPGRGWCARSGCSSDGFWLVSCWVRVTLPTIAWPP
jgi:hypothetical protein